ncbi:MAG TPA: hypothetical protein DEF82_09885 [Crocinitomicaceae bacterium]|jgi:hypothetical protein|nr:hypothetical protein [Flavobacteriales bacterium]HBW87023.1 hypothetical protein [Crocinitomicaceae bacterium]
MELNHIIKNHQTFSERIISEIQKMPFGSLPKVELELVILDALIKSLEPSDSYSRIQTHFNFLQRELKLTQTQLKNKILAAQLRFDKKSDLDVENFILDYIANKKHSIEGSYIVINIFNPLLNDLTKSYFEIRGVISDTSFNKSIVKIHLIGFIKFLVKSNRLTDSSRKELIEILNHAKDQGIINISQNLHKKSILENFESITVSSSNIISIVEKLIPFLKSLL